jgi:hypothetical protein
MKKLILFTLVVILASCSAEKKCQRVLNKAKDLGCLSETDSTKVITKFIKGDSIHDTTRLFVEKRVVDSLYLLDTCFTKERIKTIKESLKIEPIFIDNKDYKLTIRLVNGNIVYDLKLADRIDTTIVHQKQYKELDKSRNKDFKLPNILYFVGLILLLIILKRLKII